MSQNIFWPLIPSLARIDMAEVIRLNDWRHDIAGPLNKMGLGDMKGVISFPTDPQVISKLDLSKFKTNGFDLV